MFDEFPLEILALNHHQRIGGRSKAPPSSVDLQDLTRDLQDLTSFRRSLIQWYHAQNRSLPWRQFWQKHRDPYHVWVSEIMLQQTVIKVVIPVYLRFIERFPSLSAISQATEADLRESVRGLGYYRRFRMMHQCAQELVSHHQGTWPQTYEGLLALPGIGPYTAAAIASIAFNHHVAVVDGNVERIICRLFDLRVAPKSPGIPKKIRDLANFLLDQELPGDYNQALMELGQTLCTPTSPKCHQCPLITNCLAYQRQSQLLAPQPNAKSPSLAVSMKLLILCNSAPGEINIGLIQRSRESRFLKESWGFPMTYTLDNSKLDDPRLDDPNMDTLKSNRLPDLQDSRIEGRHLGDIRHSITRHRISAHVYYQSKPDQHWLTALKWVPRSKVEQALISNLDRKAWQLFGRFYKNE